MSAGVIRRRHQQCVCACAGVCDLTGVVSAPGADRAAAKSAADSAQATASAAAEIMDVTPEAVMNLFRQLDIDTLIHGHTHRPAVHEIAPADSPANRVARHRVVLGDWDRQGWFGQIDGAGAVTLHNFPFSSSESN